jgi:hypothetical protein
MKKLFILVCSLSLCFSCGPKQDKVERITEDGVDVVVNHLEPYKITGEPANLTLEEEFTIDTEKDEITELGLTDIRSFDVDTEQNIYLLHLQSRENCIFKFNKEGSFISSFGRKGQGPGEMQYPIFFQVINNELAVTNPTKVVFFSNDGKFLKEISKDANKLSVILLKNGNYLVRENFRDISDSTTRYSSLIIYDSEFNQIKEIDRGPGYPFKGDGYRAILPYIHSCVFGEKIFEGNSEMEYEIHVYDFNGNLIKKIKKEYSPVPINAENKETILKLFERMPEEIKKTIYFPDNFPPFQRLFFTDDKGRLFVMTYEKGKKPREFIYDIFNSDGAFIGRTGLENYGQDVMQMGPLPAISKNGFLYYVREKENGYKELVAYKMNWE